MFYFFKKSVHLVWKNDDFHAKIPQMKTVRPQTIAIKTLARRFSFGAYEISTRRAGSSTIWSASSWL